MSQAPYLNYNVPEYEKLKECPYNKAHQILNHRFQTHLIKCRRSYPRTQPFKTCRFNKAHVFPAPEIALHEKNCDSSINVLRYLYEEETPKQPKHEEAQIANVACSSTENWDDDNCVAYDPKKHCQENGIITNIQHMTPSQRKAARLDQRERIAHLKH